MHIFSNTQKITQLKQFSFEDSLLNSIFFLFEDLMSDSNLLQQPAAVSDVKVNHVVKMS